jgi:FixJ family two-component response regulator
MNFITYIVDDDRGVLKALARLLRTAGYQTHTYASPHDFLAEHDITVPGCVILDLSMPHIDGLALQRILSEDDLDRPVIFLTGTGDIADSVSAMKAGAIDFLTKPVDGPQLLAAVDRARAKDTEARRLHRDRELINCRISRLTPRERQVLEHVVLGRLNKQIAATLGTVEKTIKVHRGRVMAKLEVRSITELVRFAERAGLGPSG